VGAAAVLNPENALGNSFVGVEADCLLEFRASEHLWATVGGGGLFPGKAASALVNAIDRTAASPIWSGEASLTVRY
jgi:hypothetical protein